MSVRAYQIGEVSAFLRVRDPFGAFSNMAPGFPFRVGGLEVGSSEALYQALRFPHLPDFQREILDQGNPLLAKRHAYTRVGETRTDWDRARISVMRYALRAKFGTIQGRLLGLLRETGDRPIVEISHRDPFWGARPVADQFVGTNALGRLLMELRAEMAPHVEGAPFRNEPTFADPILTGVRLGAEEVGPDQRPLFDL